MYSEIIPEGDFRPPLFVSPLPFLYRIEFRDTDRSDNILTYTTPHEIILNLCFFQGGDTITYIDRIDNQELFCITMDRFKFMLTGSLYGASQDELEILYLRLLLTNRYKKTIIDKGRFLQHDLTLKNYLLTIKGGYDSHLAYDKHKVILYFKYRRLSTIHLMAVIQDWNLQHDIHFNHISIPKTIANQGLLFEAWRLEFRNDQLKIIYYDPVEEDNIQPTDIRLKIIEVINQFIK